MKKLTSNEENRRKQASETLGLMDRLKTAEEQVRTLKNLWDLLMEENAILKGKCSKLEAAVSDNEKVLENL